MSADAPEPNDAPTLLPKLPPRTIDLLAAPLAARDAIPAALPDAEVVKPRSGEPFGAREAIALLVVCLAADVLLYRVWGGLGAALFTVAAAASVTAVIGVRRAGVRTVWLAAVVALVAARSAWQPGYGTAVLAVAALLAFAAGLRFRDTFVPELALAVPASLRSGARHLGRAIRDGARRLSTGNHGARLRVIAVPALIALCFIGVFAAANPVVEDVFARLFSGIAGAGSFTATTVRVLFWALVACLGAALLRPHLETAPWSARLGPGHAQPPLEADAADDTRFRMARNVLWAVNAVFLAYNALDAVYLWAGEPPPGVDHTAYAHRGTLWLTIGLLLCTIALGVIFRGARYTGPRAQRLRLLAYVWAGQGFVLAAGTLRRIQLYVDYSGLTYLKVVGIVGSLLVIAGLALVIAKVARGRTMLWLLRRQLDALAIAIVLLIVAPVDMAVTSFNVRRIEAGEYRPVLALFVQDMTPESLPGLLPLLDHPDPTVRVGIAGYLMQKKLRLEAHAYSHDAWGQLEGARSWALSRLAGAEPRMRELFGDMQLYTAVERLRDLARAANDLSPGDRDF